MTVVAAVAVVDAAVVVAAVVAAAVVAPVAAAAVAVAVSFQLYLALFAVLRFYFHVCYAVFATFSL